MAEGDGLSTWEWLDPPGPLRRHRRAVAGLTLLSGLATALLGVTWAARLDLFVGGMLALALLGVGYVVLWALDLIAVYTDPQHEIWS